MIQEYFNKITITHIILISLVLHAFVIAQPQFLQIWDESIFLEILRDFLKGEDHVPYQMPGINFFQGPTTLIFGDNWFSWRVPSVIFGMLSLLVFYNVFREYTTEKNALLATAILSFDTIFFVHSSLFLRDVPLMFFGVLSYYFYIKKKYYFAAITLGFAFLIKETAVFFFFLIIINHVVVNYKWNPKITDLRKIIVFLVLTSLTFLIPLWIYDIIYQPIIYDPMIVTQKLPDGREGALSYPKVKLMESRGYIQQTQIGKITNPIEHLGVFLSKGYVTSEAYKVKNWDTNLTNYPHNWILPIPLPENANGLGWVKEKPFEETHGGKLHVGKIFGIEWRGDPNQVLWIVGFWSTLGLIIYGVIKNREKTILFLSSGLISMYVPYLLLQFTGRIMFPYYFILTIPFISLGVIIAIDKIKNSKLRIGIKTLFFISVVGWFVFYFPIKIL
ncbi:glycosyltransferase family 39 protein [Candidatus Nitrosopumilus sp. SW]|uniref:ArnT family glycosyltransferase n=1 Tax=Candidatus Nitrosopumilus sp. SW TaxID=2508726 RepID=UPI0011524BB5|nr:glycosyltransferase family 39 protein [Candidatus Nitrosopumilus sp. SW]QDI89542.1 glycosyltransferase family 39 protein [Candidatus Nitrosopumilus sp. SW]